MNSPNGEGRGDCKRRAGHIYLGLTSADIEGKTMKCLLGGGKQDTGK